MNKTFQTLLISGLALSLGLGTFEPSFAQTAKTPRIRSVSVDVANGNIMIYVEDGAFDPLLRMEQSPDGEYRIVVEGENVTLDNAVKQEILKLNAELSKAIPAIESVNFLQVRHDEVPITRLIFDSTGKLQPQIRGNTGNVITIALVGDKMGKPKPLVHDISTGTPGEEVGPIIPEPPKKPAPAKTAAKPQKAAEKPKPASKPSATSEKKTRDAALDTEEALPVRLEIESPPSAVLAAKSAEPEPQPEKSSLVATEKAVPQKIASANPPQKTQPASPIVRMPAAQALPSTAAPSGNTFEFDPAAVTDAPWPIKLSSTPPDFDPPAEAPPKPVKTTAKEPVIFKADFSPPKQPAQTAVATASPAAGKNPASSSKPFSLYEAVRSPSTDPVIRQAWSDLQKGDYAATEMALKTFLEQSPRDVTARYLLAQLYLANRRELTVSELENVIAIQERFLPAYHQLIPMYLEDRDYDKAERLLKKASSLWPDDFAILFFQGLMQEAMNNIGLAETYYLGSLKSDPLHAMPHLRLAQLALKTNRPNMAKWELQQAALLSPGDPRITKLLGSIAEQENNLGIANTYYQKALQLDLMLDYARYLENRNEAEKATSLYTAVETLAADNPDVLYNLGMIYTQRKDTKRAEAVMKRFLKLTDGMEDARVLKAKEMVSKSR